MRHLLPDRETRRLDFWMMELKPSKPLNIAGGRSLSDGPDAVPIDVAIVGDRDGVVYRVPSRPVSVGF